VLRARAHAQRYMRLAKRRSFIEAKSDNLSDLRVSGALALLALPKHGRDDFIKDLGELAEKTVDSASDFMEMETQSEKAEFQLQRALINEATAALDRVGEIARGREDEFGEDFARRICIKAGEYKAARLAELGARLETLVDDPQSFYAEYLAMKPRPQRPSPHITNIAREVRDVAVEWLRKAEQAA
jgi:hypothetical protein